MESKRLIAGLGCVLGLLGMGAAAPERQASLRTTVRWTYFLKPTPGTEKLVFLCNVPRNREGWQRLDSMEFSHPPTDIVNDRGDSYARFYFERVPSTIALTVTATLDLHPTSFHSQLHGDAPPVLSDRMRKVTTSPEEYLESQHPKIVQLANSIHGGSTIETLQQVQQIVQSRIHRGQDDYDDHGAVKALERGKGDCSEYTDLFVTLCRARGIPALACGGFLVDPGTQRTNPYHEWAMVWIDGRGWTRVDPSDIAGGYGTVTDQPSWYVHLRAQRVTEALPKGHLWGFRCKGTAPDIKATFEVLERQRL